MSSSSDLHYQDLLDRHHSFQRSKKEVIVTFEPENLSKIEQLGDKPNDKLEITGINRSTGFARLSVRPGHSYEEAIDSLKSIVTGIIPAMIEGGMLAQQDSTRYFLYGRVVIQMKQEFSGDTDKAKKIIVDYGLKVIKAFDTPIGYFSVEIPIDPTGPTPEEQLFKKIRDLNDASEFEYVEPNECGFDAGLLLPNDPKLAVTREQWGAKDYQASNADINCEQAWGLTTGIGNVVIAVLDTGIAYAHPDFAGKITEQYNAITQSQVLANVDDTDVNSHGTAICGVVGAATNNAAGIAGVGYNCKVMPVKVDDDMNAPDYAAIVRGINWVKDKAIAGSTANPPRRYIMNLSWKVTDSADIHNAIINAYNNNVVIVAAAGDNTADVGVNPVYPACYAEVIPVGAHIRNSTFPKRSDSNCGTIVVMAPGDSIMTTIRGNAYANKNGSSLAAGFVSGTCALVWSKNYQLHANSFTYTKTNVRNTVLNNLDPISGYNNRGRCNASSAVSATT